MYELTCVVSIFSRRLRQGCTCFGPAPRLEERFRYVLPDDFSADRVTRALASLVPEVEAWLVQSQADLAKDTVVTVYSIEVVDVPPLDVSGD